MAGFIEPTVILVEKRSGSYSPGRNFWSCDNCYTLMETRNCDVSSGDICSCFEEGVDIANGTEYGLTGAIFTDDPIEN
jgi:hypothetical protein